MLTLERMLHVSMRPAARAWYAAKMDQWQVVPRPEDDPQVVVPGPDTDRILLIGDGPAVGYGVVSHKLALPGALARRLSHDTGRGAHVEVAPDPWLIMGALPEALNRRNLRGTDAVVITTGVGDACRLTSVRAWRRGIREALDAVERRGRRDTHVFWLGMPPVAAIPVLRGPFARIVQHHATLLNHSTATSLAGHPRATFVPFEAEPHRDGERHRSAATFARWAELIVPVLHRALDEQVRGPVTK